MKALTLALIISILSLSARGCDFYLVSKPPPKPEFTACEGFMALVVLGVGTVVIIKICRADFWTNIPTPPTPPPAPPATNNVSTNKPPAKHWWNWNFGGGKSTKSPPLSGLLFSTNCSWISPDGLVFDSYARVMAPVDSSRDLTNWAPCYVDSWASTNGTLCLLYDGQGLPLYTNYTTDDSTNVIDGIWCTEPQEFFRYQP